MSPPTATAAEAPPYNAGAERAVLGAILNSVAAYDAVNAHLVGPDDFYLPWHRNAYAAIQGLLADGIKPDVVTVIDWLGRHKLLDQVPDDQPASALLDLQVDTPSIGNAGSYAEIVARCAADRRIEADLLDARARLHAGDRNAALASIDKAIAHAKPTGMAALDFEDVASVARGDVDSIEPTMFARSDGARLLYPGLLHWLMGTPGRGKTFVALHVAAEVLTAGGTVLYLDWEGNRRIVGSRLAALGVPAHVIEGCFLYLRPKQLTTATMHALASVVAEREVALTVGDGTAKALARQGLNEDKAADTLAWLDLVVTPVIDAGSAVLLLDHVVKDNDTRGLWPRGSGAKLGEVSGAAWLVKAKSGFSREQSGAIELVQAKDREGFTAVDGDTVAVITFDPSNHGRRLSVTVDPPEGRSSEKPDADDYDGPTHCMSAVLNVLQAAPGHEYNLTELVRTMRSLGQRFRQETVSIAATRLALDHTVRFRKGARGSNVYSWHPADTPEQSEFDNSDEDPAF